ncbi:hypothetical protein ACA910_016633 [Epithemia clementina (nom. ined.)]
MGQWYLPPSKENQNCEGTVRFNPIRTMDADNGPLMVVRELSWSNFSNTTTSNRLPSPTVNRIFAIDPKILPARMFLFHPSTMLACANAASPEEAKMLFYCKDTNATMSSNLPVEARDIPILLQFGDASETKAPVAFKQSLNLNHAGETLSSHPVVPHMKKFRKAWTFSKFEEVLQPENCPGANILERPSENVKQITQPIIWKLNVKRHYSKLKEVPCNDRPWDEKKSGAVFRGRLNGFINKAVQSRIGMSDKGTCISTPRCRLVYNSRKSSRVDAKLTSVGGRIGGVLDGYNMTGAALSMAEMLEYKALIILEGNDVSSGLKWALLSNSIVMMPSPMFTSWAMEERLEPWIHYVPLRDDLSDVEERLTWVLTHKQEAARIVRRATLWILDLLFHPDAERDEKQVFTQMLQRYARHFVLDPTLDQSIVA